MKMNSDEKERSGLLIGSEPLGGVQHRSASKTDDNDAGKDNPIGDADGTDGDTSDADGTDSDKSDSDGTDSGDKGSDTRDADGRD